MEEKLSGIVLNGVQYGESDKILNIFTLEKGTISAKIKGVKKAGAKLKFASEPFCFAEFIFSEVSNRRTVIGASLIESFYALRENIVKYFAGGTILEFIRRFAKENIVSKELFMLSIKTLKDICYSDKDEIDYYSEVDGTSTLLVGNLIFSILTLLCVLVVGAVFNISMRDETFANSISYSIKNGIMFVLVPFLPLLFSSRVLLENLSQFEHKN